VELYIFSRDLEFEGIVDSYTSLIWTRRYSKCGEFELNIALTTENLALLVRTNIIYKKDDSEAGVIIDRNITQDTDGKEVLNLKGKFITGYLNSRITWGTKILNTTSEITMRTLVSDNCILPQDTKRIMNKLVLSPLKNYVDDINYQVSNKNLTDEIESLSVASNLGHRINLDISNKQLIFEVYKGIDRSVNQEINPKIIFSKEFENIMEQKYTDSFNNYKNVALVNGVYTYKQTYSVEVVNDDGSTTEEEKTEDVTVNQSVTIGDSNSGLDRYEIFVDGGDISSTGTNDAGEDITIDQQASLDILTGKGNTELAQYVEVEAFDSTINLNSNLTYKIDFDLGDIVTIVSKKWNITLDSRITEVEEVYEKEGKTINVTFGNNIPTILDKIKQKLK